METLTIFYRHPFYCSTERIYITKSDSASGAGEEAAVSLAEVFPDNDEPDELELSTIIDDMQVEVFAGEHYIKPDRAPDWTSD